MPKNPHWTRDELILALDLYFRVSPRHTSEKNPEIVALSQLLNRMPLHPASVRSKNFRSPDSVYLKLCNFLHFDPDYLREGKVGLDAGSKLDRDVWDYFFDDKQKLAEIASSIKANYNKVDFASVLPEFDDAEFPEGQIVERTHQQRERNPALIRRKKDWGLKKYGRLYCEVCGFDFTERYGELGKGFIECHHKNPLSDSQDISKTKLEDLAFVCPNCHRMLHRIRPWISIEELKMHLI